MDISSVHTEYTVYNSSYGDSIPSLQRGKSLLNLSLALALERKMARRVWSNGRYLKYLESPDRLIYHTYIDMRHINPS